jgi:serine-type anaerobic sulfatase-maturating enzyme
MAGLAVLRRHGVEWNALTTVHVANQDRGREIYRFLRDECGARFMQFIPIVERATAQTLPAADAGRGQRVKGRPLYTQEGSLVTGRSVSPGGYGRFLIDVFEDWVRRDVGEVYVQMFDVALATGTASHRGCVSIPRRAAWRSRSSTTATCTRATTSWSRATSSATSARRR